MSDPAAPATAACQPGDQRSAVIAAVVRQPGPAALALGGAHRFGHLRRLDRRFGCGAHEILAQREQSFEVDNFPFTLSLTNGGHPSRVGDVEHYQHAATPPAFSRSAEPFYQER